MNWPNISPDSPYLAELKHLDPASLHRRGPLVYQDRLYALVREQKPKVVIETGVCKGVSTVMILAALGQNGDGHLFSCDPCYVNQDQAAKSIHKALKVEVPMDRWTFVGKRSIEALKDWKSPDIFVHDSDHRAQNMAFELEWAWEHLRPGGWLVCDDFASRTLIWKHKVFPTWAQKAGVTPEVWKTAAVVQKAA
jgi:predicted O-methyltransferase YrrM